MKIINKKRKYILKRENNRRMAMLLTIAGVFFAIIIIRILYLNVFMASYYDMMLDKNTDRYVYGEDAPRGRILDRNGKVLVSNKAVKGIYYKKKSNISLEEEIELSYKMSKILSLDYKNILKRNLKEFYILINKDETDKLIKPSEYKDLENRKLTLEQIYELKIKRIKDNDLKKMKSIDRKAAYLYYLMNKGYSYDEKEIKSGNVSEKEYAYFSENSNKLKGFYSKLIWERSYPYGRTLENILGGISSKESGLPKEEKDEYLKKGYALTDRVGISGLEKYYEDILRGEKAVYVIGDNNNLKLIKKAKKGLDIKLSIDIDLQLKIDKMLENEIIKAKSEANTEYFNRSYVVIENPNTGEILSMSGKIIKYQNGKYKAYDNSEGVFLSTITPGSVVKGASIMVGYTTGAIDIGTSMIDACIGLYNLPEKCSWKTLGYINDLEALAMSSNVYQYKIAMKVGGFDYAYGKKLKIDEKAFDTYRNMFYRFGLGVKTGIDQEFEEVGYKSNERAGDLLINYAIGQYDTYTTLQLSQYISTIASNGKRYKTRFLNSVISESGDELYKIKPTVLNTLDVKPKYLERVKKGLRGVLTYGTGVGYMNEEYIPSGKTGTSESFIDLDNDGYIDAESISNNFVGFAPSNKPVMAIAAAFPDIQNPKGGEYKSSVNQVVVSKATDIFFDLYDKNGVKIDKKSNKIKKN